MKSETLAEVIGRVEIFKDLVFDGPKSKTYLDEFDCQRISNTIIAWMTRGHERGEQP